MSSQAMKPCSTCKEMQPLTAYPRRAASPDGYHCLCLRCNRAKVAAWRKANPERWAISNERSRKRRYYGVEDADIDRMLDEQFDACAICCIEFSDDLKPNIDHDHLTGKARGLLCRPCNTGLGHFKDDPANLIAAIRYLRGYNAPTDEVAL